MLLMNKIKSRWEFDIDGMNKSHIDYALRSNYAMTIIRSITTNFINRNKEYAFSEIFSVAQEGFWKAIKTYNSSKGKFSTHATYVCKTNINKYTGLTNGKRSIKSNIVEFSICETDKSVDIEKDINNKILIEEVLRNVSHENRKILITHFLMCTKKKESVAHLNITRPTFEVKLKAAIREAQKVACLL